MHGIPLHKRVVRHGHGYAIPLTRDDLRRLALAEDDEVDVQVTPRHREIDWDALPLLRRHGPQPHDPPGRRQP